MQPPEEKRKSSSWPKRLLPPLILLLMGILVIGIALTFIFPTGVLTPSSFVALDLIRADYQAMLDEGTLDFPPETTVYREWDECWKPGKTLCIYGWYTEWRDGVYLASYTMATLEDEQSGVLRGWWWEVDVPSEQVRPVWLSEPLQALYRLRRTDPFAKQTPPPRPTLPPLLKAP
ncbi:MAG: hypothetical protein LLH30_05225 [Candidatus Manganitrophus sp. SA1]|nr:hypothetical protein [Candidatus Manganitrophus morganii]